MNESPAQRAFAASAVSLFVAAAGVAMFLPPLGAEGAESPLRSALLGLGIAVGLLLHWVFLAIGAARAGRSVAGWVALSLLLCPVGSVAALVLLAWLQDEAQASPA